MKKIAVFCVVLFGFAALAGATTIPLVSGNGPNPANPNFDMNAYLTITPNNTTDSNGVHYDLVKLIINAANQNPYLPDPVTEVTPTGTTAIAGTFENAGAFHGAGYSLVSDTAVASVNASFNSPPDPAVVDWASYATGTTAPGAPGGYYDYNNNPLSYIHYADSDGIGPRDLAGILSNGGNGGNTVPGVDDWLFGDFNAGWSAGLVDNNPVPINPGGTIASLYVAEAVPGTAWAPTSGTAIYTGAIGFNPNGFTNNSNYYAYALPTPEPASLVLLTSGLVGLLAYAWKRRR